MTRLLSMLGLASLATTVALAQTQNIILPPQAATTDPSTSQNYLREIVEHYQSVYDSTSFTSQGVFSPVQIDTLAYRPSATTLGFATVYPSVDVYVSYAATDYAAMSLTYTANRSVAFPTTSNYSGAVTMTTVNGQSPINQDYVTINLTTPFVYDPSLGQDLLIEIFINAVPAPAMPTASIPTQVSSNSVSTHKTASVRTLGNVTAVTGSASVFSPAVKLVCSTPPNLAKHEPYGAGCVPHANSLYEVFAGAAPASTNDLSNTNVLFFQNPNGGYDTVSLPNAGTGITMPTTTGLALTDDSVSPAITLPFTFNYPGGSTNTIYVDSNGSIALGGAAAPASLNSPIAATLLNSDRPRFAVGLQDMLPDGATNVANVFAEVDPTNPSAFLITWVNVPNWISTNIPSGLTTTCQIALIDSGTQDTVEYRYYTISNDSSNLNGGMVTGWSRGGGAIDGGNKDLSGAVSTVAELPGLLLSTVGRPKLGGPAVTYQLSNIRPGGICMMQCSFGKYPTGVALPLLGVASPGCNAYIDPALMNSFGGLLFGSPTDGFSQSWPAGPYLGMTLYVQGFEIEFGPTFDVPSGVISSNGLDVILGIN